MVANDDGPADNPLEETSPPRDVVDSRWWYWIAAYVLSAVLFVPVVVIAGVAFVAPIAVVGSGVEPGIGAPLGVLLFVFALLVFGVILVASGVFLLFPVALYLDAQQVARADLDWEPDPVLYGCLGLLQFVITPVVGLFVAIYYLYRRHEHVGVP